MLSALYLVLLLVVLLGVGLALALLARTLYRGNDER